MNRYREPTKEMRSGRRALEDLAVVTLLQDWTWHKPTTKWFLHCRLGPALADKEPGLSETDWFILVHDRYPLGSIRFLPAKERGISDTYFHQDSNELGLDDRPWRDGQLCLQYSHFRLSRHAHDLEERSAPRRLLWYVRRAIEWLQCASEGKLVRDGDPFELPHFKRLSLGSELIAFSEEETSFERWSRIDDEQGLVNFIQLRDKPLILVVKEFLSLGQERLLAPAWGRAVKGKEVLGVWIRAENLPIIPPWQAPRTWDDLNAVMATPNKSLFDLLLPTLKKIRDGSPHTALIGFPCSRRFGQQSCQMHWQALNIPKLSNDRAAKGFRHNEKGYRMRDNVQIFRSNAKVHWQPSQNWHQTDIGSRGQLPEAFRQHHVLMIGAGAVGSILAELLVRGGIQSMVVLDDDHLEAGNLVRHSLHLDSLQLPKATQLAQTLNKASPHAQVSGIVSEFPVTDEDQLKEVQACDLVIDCTADDEVLLNLDKFAWEEERKFISISLGYAARRVFCFTAVGHTFPHDVFITSLEPWIAKERSEYPPDSFPREGVGCWNPVFPAGIGDVWMMTCVALKHLVDIATTDQWGTSLAVFEEQTDEEGRFASIRKVDLRDLNG